MILFFLISMSINIPHLFRSNRTVLNTLNAALYCNEFQMKPGALSSDNKI